MAYDIGETHLRYIVCAANKFPCGLVVCGARHYDRIMIEQIRRANIVASHICEQGFIDNFGEFITREDAYIIAKLRNQLRPNKSHIPGTLYSEDLY